MEEDATQQAASASMVANTTAAVSPTPKITANEEVPSVTIDPNNVKSAVTSVSLQSPALSKMKTTAAADVPTVIELKSPANTTKAEAAVVAIVIEEEAIAMPNHALFDALLQKAVSTSGQVNYNTIKSNNADLDAYISELSNNQPDNSWSKNSAMAYWINAYNAFTLKLVADNYPITSIKDLHNGNPWTVKWIKLAGSTYSLDQIENEILRPRYKDARIHFAVNCAAKSCPPLHNRAFTEDNLNSKLNRLTRSFINNENYNTISADQLVVSKIFDWYASDFGMLTDFIDRYTDTEINSGATIKYQEYDWSLNE